jgi:hypothetical protein
MCLGEGTSQKEAEEQSSAFLFLGVSPVSPNTRIRRVPRTRNAKKCYFRRCRSSQPTPLRFGLRIAFNPKDID